VTVVGGVVVVLAVVVVAVVVRAIVVLAVVMVAVVNIINAIITARGWFKWQNGFLNHISGRARAGAGAGARTRGQQRESGGIANIIRAIITARGRFKWQNGFLNHISGRARAGAGAERNVVVGAAGRKVVPLHSRAVAGSRGTGGDRGGGIVVGGGVIIVMLRQLVAAAIAAATIPRVIIFKERAREGGLSVNDFIVLGESVATGGPRIAVDIRTIITTARCCYRWCRCFFFRIRLYYLTIPASDFLYGAANYFAGTMGT
jgi:hypothetical protein